jgi:hypothetical protein
MLQIDADGRFLSGTMSVLNLWETAKNQKENAIPVRSDVVPRLDAQTSQWIMPSAGPLRYAKAHTFDWLWSATSAMVFRRHAIELSIPRDPETVGICADHYLIHICHYFAGSVLMDEVLGAHRRHQKNFFSYLPVFGSSAFSSMRSSQEKLNNNNIRTMLRHLLDRHAVFCSTFGGPPTRGLIQLLAVLLGQLGMPLDEARLRPILGAKWYYRARLSRQVSGMRRRLSRAFHNK